MDTWCHFVIALLAIHLPVILAEGCDGGWEEYGDMCYYFSYNISASRDDAKNRCIGLGGMLASVANKDIDDYFHRQMMINSTGAGSYHHWIGLIGTDEPSITSNWKWLDGNVVDPGISWFPGEPTSEQTVCGKIGSYGTADLALGNRECTSSIWYICEATTAHARQGWVKFENHLYLFQDTGVSKNFIQAFNECLFMDASLASIETQDELVFIRNRTVKSQEYWIGLTTLHWFDHSPITYLNYWNTNELNMNNPCVYLHTSRNKWENDCREDNRFICQKAKPITSTTDITTTATTLTTSTSAITTNTSHKPSLSPSSSTTAQSEPQDAVDDDSQMTSESSQNIDANSGIAETVEVNNNNIPMIIGIVIGIIVIIALIITTVYLIRRRRLQNKEQSHIYYNTAEILQHNGNTRNQDIVYDNAEEIGIGLHNISHNTDYQDVSYDNPENNVPSAGHDAGYQEVGFDRHNLTGFDRHNLTDHHATENNVRIGNSNSLDSSYQKLRFDDNAPREAQNIITYQDLNSVATSNE